MNNTRFVLWPFLLLAFEGSLFGQSNIDESPVVSTLYVDQARGNDGNAGTGAAPFSTIGKAVEKINAGAAATKVCIAPGVYEEGEFTITNRDILTIFEGSGPGDVIITGSERWTDWSNDGTAYYKTWTHNWGLRPSDPNLPLKTVGRRCEMVFVGGDLQQQVETYADLVPGSYFVDEAANRLYFLPLAGVDPEVAEVRVSVRRSHFFLFRVTNFVFRNLVFEHAASGLQHTGHLAYTFAVFGEDDSGGVTNVPSTRDFTQHVLIDACTFRQNNHQGVIIANSKNITVQDSSLSDNGVEGLGVSRSRSLLIEDSDFSRNNWRYGLWGGVSTWSPAGSKLLHCDSVTVRRCAFNANYAAGLWFDFGNENILVEDTVITHNRSNGFYFEASIGPCVLRRSTIAYNGVDYIGEDYWACGILFAESKDLTVDDCLVVENHYIQIAARPNTRASSGYFSGIAYDGACEELTLTDSTIIAGFDFRASPYAWYLDPQRSAATIGLHTHGSISIYASRFLPAYRGNNNRYFSYFDVQVFSSGGGSGFDQVTLANWKTLTGEDADSNWDKLVDPDRDGVSYIVELALGLSTIASDRHVLEFSDHAIVSAGLPLIRFNGRRTFVFPRSSKLVAKGMSYTVEFSSDLHEWISTSEMPTLLHSFGDVELLEMTYPDLLPDGSIPLFSRLSID